MKHWNELDKNNSFKKIFSFPVEIGRIAIISLSIEDNQHCIGMEFDIPELSDNLPKKNKGYDMCRVSAHCYNIKNTSPMHKVFTVKIKKNSVLIVEAINDRASRKFSAKYISLNSHNICINVPNNYYFSQPIFNTITTHKLTSNPPTHK